MMKLMKYVVDTVDNEDGGTTYILKVKVLIEPVWQWSTVSPCYFSRFESVTKALDSYRKNGYETFFEES